MTAVTAVAAVVATCALAGGVWGWLLPRLAEWLSLRWGLFDDDEDEEQAGETEEAGRADEVDVAGEVDRIEASPPGPAALAEPAEPADDEAAPSAAAAPPGPPVWHRVSLALCAGAAFGAAAVRYGVSPQLPAALVMLGWLGLVAAIDLQTYLIPNRLTYPALMLAPLAPLWTGASLASHGLGGLASAGFFGLAHALNRQGIGFGDVKLALVLGLYLGWSRALVALAATTLLGGLAAVVALLFGRSHKASIPYGPALAAGGALALLIGAQ